jgi:hypothetical protein
MQTVIEFAPLQLKEKILISAGSISTTPKPLMRIDNFGAKR